MILPFSYHNAVYVIGWTIRKYLGLRFNLNPCNNRVHVLEWDKRRQLLSE